MFRKYYAAYGSNLNLGSMKFRAPNFKVVGTFDLVGYRLVYKGGGDGFAYLTLEAFEGGKVPLGIYDISCFNIKNLDFYEGYPVLYSKYYLPIKVGGKERKALIYIMNERFDYHMPSLEYIEDCKKGYDDFGFDKAILDQALEDSKSCMVKRKTYPR